MAGTSRSQTFWKIKESAAHSVPDDDDDEFNEYAVCMDCGQKQYGKEAWHNFYCFHCWQKYRSWKDRSHFEDHDTCAGTTTSKGIQEATIIDDSGATTGASIEPSSHVGDKCGNDENVQEGAAKIKPKPKRQPARLWCQLLLHKHRF